MDYTTIISVEELNKILNNHDLVILDCRFDLLQPEWGFSEYKNQHIPRAAFADLNKQLSGPIMQTSGRHPLPLPEVFIKQLSQWGVGNETQVVAYDANSGGFASRAWFMLKMYGHNKVAVLDGGWQEWIRASYPTSSGEETNPGKVFHSSGPVDGFFVNTFDVITALSNPANLIIDVRNPERYRGEVEPIDPIAGHIPGAVNRPISLNLQENGLFKSPLELRSEIRNLLKNLTANNAIIYCGSGVTSCHLALAMELAGLSGAKVYAGSWSEWIRDPSRPIEK